MKPKFIFLLIAATTLFASGGYDNGTSTGKGKFQLDLTWNPLNKIDFGQTYFVMSYGLTNKLDVHGYISNHADNYQTWYGGIFYQFFRSKKLHLATAIGIRKRFNRNRIDVFTPQLLYTVNLTDRIYIGGSFVDVRSQNLDNKYGTSIDIGVFYRLKYQTKNIESISISFGGFHPATWNPGTFFLPTYSIDIKF